METTVFTVQGLADEAEIIIDEWGVPHIRAASAHDLYFVQGFNAARDRLWQLDIWRKRGLGRLAGSFGPGFLAQDRAARLFVYRGDLDAEWAAYGPQDTKAIVGRFTAGINAYLDLLAHRADLLPVEFQLLGIRPERWEAEDVVRVRSHALVRNVLSEVTRANVIARGGMDIDPVRKWLEPPWQVQLPEGLEPEPIPEAVLDVFKLATAEFSITEARRDAPLEEAARWATVSDAGEVLQLPEGAEADTQGSNNWAIAAERTRSGRPILASDPHRLHQLPSLRYIAHLSAPGINVIGVGEPAVPGISMGHNDEAAFSLTIFPADQEDVYVYELDQDDETRYRYGEGWERMTEVREIIEVLGHPAQETLLRFTRHGPVLHIDRQRRRAYAVRSVWFEPGTAAYLCSLAYMEASSPEDFEAAVSRWGAPSVNHVYADVRNNIAWFAAGKIPIRPNWDGLLPVPGDGRYEWQGFFPRSALPSLRNPACGFVTTSNEMNLPADYPYVERKLGFEWLERSRATRIREVLSAPGPHGFEDSLALQVDDFSVPARRMAVVLERHAAALRDGDAAKAARYLAGWDHHLDTESGPAALFEVWWSRHLKPAVTACVASDPALRRLITPVDHESLLMLLEAGDPRVPAAIVAQTLAEGWRDCVELMGDRPDVWAWGRLHHGYFPHRLTSIFPEHKERFDVGPYPTRGSVSAPLNAAYRVSDFRVTSGSSFRMVLDIGNWDAAVMVNAPGQSGDVRSEHYRKLAPHWAAGTYVPMLFSTAAVDAAATARIRLEPMR